MSLFTNNNNKHKYNQSPLFLKTFDGSNSPYHPTVKYKKEGYGGYEFIMSETPFYLTLPSVGKNYRDQFECPCIHYSHDGIHWEDVISNPIDKLSEEEKLLKNSIPEMAKKSGTPIRPISSPNTFTIHQSGE